LLVRDFISARNFQVLKDTLNYLVTLGVNAIELMPFNEFEGNESWGYNPDFYFAPDKYYGTKDMLKAFIDACHENGIAVIQDMVLNHSCGQSPLCQLYWDAAVPGPSADNPWFNPDQNGSQPGYQGKHPFGVCYDVNHESVYTQKWVDDILKYWNQEYKIDGWRFDLSKGFTQTYSGDDVALWGHYDQSRINNLNRISDEIRSVDPNVILILEHFADQSEEQVLSADGFYLWSNSNYNYAQCAMGYSSSSDISWVSYKSHGFTDPHAVGFMESHDEERVMYKVITYGNYNSTYNVRPLDSALNRIKQAACFFIPVPGPKMIWQFGELGYDYSIQYGGSNVSPKPIKWEYFTFGPRKWLYNFYAALIDLKHSYDVFQTTDFLMSVSSLKKSVRLNDPAMNVCILGNFDITAGDQTPSFQHTGWWYDYFTGDSLNVTDVNAQLHLEPGEYRFYTDVKLPAPELGNVGIDDPSSLHTLHLYQNVPNPFGTITTVDFYVPKAGTVLLEVYDLFGRLITVIANKNMGVGYYTVDVPGEDFAAGTYICKLTQDGLSKTIKMQVVK
jgi:glycosidase